MAERPPGDLDGTDRVGSTKIHAHHGGLIEIGALEVLVLRRRDKQASLPGGSRCSPDNKKWIHRGILDSRDTFQL